MKTLIQLIKGVVFYSLLLGAILAPIATAGAIDAGRADLALCGTLFTMIFFAFLGMFSNEEIKDWSLYNVFKKWCHESN